MKIIFVSDAIYPYNKGGKEKRIHGISTRLAKHGHNVHIFTMKWWAGPKIIKENNVVLHGISKLLPLYTSKKRRSVKQALYFSYKIFLALLFEKFDVIEADQVPYFQLFPLKIIALARRKKLIVSWLEVWGKKYWLDYLGWKGYFGYIIEKISVRLPDRFIAISQLTKNKLIHKFNISPHKITYIPASGINIEKFSNIEITETFDCIYCGRLLNHKNINIFIEAIKILQIKDTEIKCLIIGEGPEKQNLIKLVNILSLQKNIKFLDFIEQEEKLFSYINSSKVFVLPSTREGFGISVIEANACGKQVVAINHPDNAAKDLLSENNTGFICQLEKNSLASAIEKALSQANSEKIKRHCLNNAKKYQWTNIIQQTLDCYKNT